MRGRPPPLRTAHGAARQRGTGSALVSALPAWHNGGPLQRGFAASATGSGKLLAVVCGRFWRSFAPVSTRFCPVFHQFFHRARRLHGHGSCSTFFNADDPGVFPRREGGIDRSRYKVSARTPIRRGLCGVRRDLAAARSETFMRRTRPPSLDVVGAFLAMARGSCARHDISPPFRQAARGHRSRLSCTIIPTVIQEVKNRSPVYRTAPGDPCAEWRIQGA